MAARGKTAPALALAAALLSCRERPAAPPPLPPSPSAREVRIDSAPPGAEAIVAGQRCSTPCSVQLEPGLYRVVLRKAGYLPYDADLAVGATGEAGLSASLVASH